MMPDFCVIEQLFVANNNEQIKTILLFILGTWVGKVISCMQ